MKRKPPGWEIDPPDSFLFIYYEVRYEQGLCGSPLVFSCKEDKTEGCKSEHHGKANTAGEADAAGQPDGGQADEHVLPGHDGRVNAVGIACAGQGIRVNGSY